MNHGEKRVLPFIYRSRVFEEHDEILQPGDSYSIPGGTKHSMDALEDSKVLDFFVPTREDCL